MLDASGDGLAAARDNVMAGRPIAPEDKTREDLARQLLASHPPIPERIAAMESIADRVSAVPADGGSAAVLIPGSAAAAAAEQCIVFGYRQRLDWDELITRSFAAGDQRFANVVYESAADLVGEPAATLATVVALVAAGRTAALVQAVTSDRAYGWDAVQVFSVLVPAAAIGPAPRAGGSPGTGRTNWWSLASIFRPRRWPSTFAV